MRHGDVILTLQYTMTSRPMCGRRAVVRFCLSHGLVRVHVCLIELSRFGKNNGNLNLVCENIHYTTLTNLLI